jgi:hypothetical protein
MHPCLNGRYHFGVLIRVQPEEALINCSAKRTTVVVVVVVVAAAAAAVIYTCISNVSVFHWNHPKEH